MAPEENPSRALLTLEQYERLISAATSEGGQIECFVKLAWHTAAKGPTVRLALLPASVREPPASERRTLPRPKGPGRLEVYLSPDEEAQRRYSRVQSPDNPDGDSRRLTAKDPDAMSSFIVRTARSAGIESQRCRSLLR
jgi:hypothetical protein